MKLHNETAYETLLTEQETIERLGLADRPNPISSLRWLVRTKKLGCVRVACGILRFRPADVQALIERCHDAAK